jgi:hypothetical protein
MDQSDDRLRLKSELEHAKTDLRQDLSQVRQKFQDTRVELSPTSFIRHEFWLISSVAFVMGLLLGYRRVPLDEIVKPVTRTMLNTAGKRATLRVMRRWS